MRDITEEILSRVRSHAHTISPIIRNTELGFVFDKKNMSENKQQTTDRPDHALASCMYIDWLIDPFSWKNVEYMNKHFVFVREPKTTSRYNREAAKQIWFQEESINSRLSLYKKKNNILQIPHFDWLLAKTYCPKKSTGRGFKWGTANRGLKNRLDKNILSKFLSLERLSLGEIHYMENVFTHNSVPVLLRLINHVLPKKLSIKEDYECRCTTEEELATYIAEIVKGEINYVLPFRESYNRILNGIEIEGDRDRYEYLTSNLGTIDETTFEKETMKFQELCKLYNKK